MTSAALMIYGATGYVGEHVTREAARLGRATIVAGRDTAKLDRIAGQTGNERRAFQLEDPSAIDRALKGVAVVLNCAGPFKYTAAPLVKAVCARAPTVSTSPARSPCTRLSRPGTQRPKRAA